MSEDYDQKPKDRREILPDNTSNSTNATLRADPPRTRRPVLSPLYGAGVGPREAREGSPDPGARGGPSGPPPGTAGQPGSPGGRSGPSGPQNPENPPKRGIFPKNGQNRPFWGIPGETPFSGLFPATGGPPRGVDVKPPSEGIPGMGKKACFWPKRPKLAKIVKKALFGLFWGFWGFWGPWRGSREAPEGLFYINPSRRGPAVPAGGSRRGLPTPVPKGTGVNPRRGYRGPPPGRSVAEAR